MMVFGGSRPGRKNYHKPRNEMGAFELEHAREKARLYYQRNRNRINAALRQRRLDDPDWAERQRARNRACLLYTSPSPRDRQKSRMPSSA